MFHHHSLKMKGCHPLECMVYVATRGYPVCLVSLVKVAGVTNKHERKSIYQGALQSAARTGNIACVKILVKAGANVNRSLIKEAEGGHGECVEFLLSKGADANRAEHKGGYTALHVAAKLGHNGILIKSGANVNIIERSGYTSLHLAAGHWHKMCVDLLIKAGAYVNYLQKRGFTTLTEAISFGHTNCVSSLIEAGADVNATTLYGHSAISVASKKKISCPTFQLLIEAGADVNSKDMLGTPVIVDAASKCICNELQVLLDAGADVNIMDKERNTALTVASGSSVGGRVERVKALLRSGARVNSFNNNKQNALCSHISKSKDLNKQPDRTMVLLLYAAGETLDGITIDEDDDNTSCVLDYLDKREINLKELCREAIRKHLLKLNLNQCLYNKIPRLGLPKSLTQYMLCDISLDKKTD